MYILDTNTLIYYFKNQGNVAQNLEAVSPENIVISTIVLFELQVGLSQINVPYQTIAATPAASAPSYSSPVRSRFGIGSGNHSRSVRATRNADRTHGLLSAGTAVALQGTIVTRNGREFSRIVGLPIVDLY